MLAWALSLSLSHPHHSTLAYIRSKSTCWCLYEVITSLSMCHHSVVLSSPLSLFLLLLLPYTKVGINTTTPHTYSYKHTHTNLHTFHWLVNNARDWTYLHQHWSSHGDWQLNHLVVVPPKKSNSRRRHFFYLGKSKTFNITIAQPRESVGGAGCRETPTLYYHNLHVTNYDRRHSHDELGRLVADANNRVHPGLVHDDRWSHN